MGFMARWNRPHSMSFVFLYFTGFGAVTVKKDIYCLKMSLLFDFLPGKKTVKFVLPGNTGYSCILGSCKKITLPGKKQPRYNNSKRVNISPDVVEYDGMT